MKIKVNDNHVVEVNILNSRLIELVCDKNVVNVQTDGKSIQAVYFYDGFFLELDDLFPVVEDTIQYFKISSIIQIEPVKSNERRFVFIHEGPSKSYHYLAPLVADSETDVGFNTALINFYAYKKEELTGTVLHAKYRLLNKYSVELEEIKNLPTCVKSTTNSQEGTMECIFQIPEEWKEDYYKILHGSYSKISTKAKNKILKFHNLKSNGTTAKILNGDVEYRKNLQKTLGISFIPEEGESKISPETESI